MPYPADASPWQVYAIFTSIKLQKVGVITERQQPNGDGQFSNSMLEPDKLLDLEDA